MTGRILSEEKQCARLDQFHLPFETSVRDDTRMLHPSPILAKLTLALFEEISSGGMSVQNG